MKYFEKLDAKLTRLDILHCDPDPKSKRIAIATRCGFLLIYITYFLTPACYFLFEAQTVREHSESLSFVLFTSLILGWYSGFLFQRENYEATIDELNTMIEKSKLQFQDKIQ